MGTMHYPPSVPTVKGAHDITAAIRRQWTVKRWQLVVNWTVHKGMGQEAAAGRGGLIRICFEGTDQRAPEGTEPPPPPRVGGVSGRDGDSALTSTLLRMPATTCATFTLLDRW